MSRLKKFGTAPVFFTAISTILGAIMFLRFGFAVGQVGLFETILIILLGHAVTIPTAMALAEIATNQKVEGGGEYYIISRSFGLVIGSSIGIALYFSQAISVAFYIIAFSEAFSPLFDYLSSFNLPDWVNWIISKKQTVSIPALLVLTAMVLTKGADLGVKALYIVVITLAFSLIAFFAGGPVEAEVLPMDTLLHTDQLLFEDTVNQTDPNDIYFMEQTEDLDPIEQKSNGSPIIPLGFFAVFAIIFPAFTGMTAGVGLSGDLENPSKSIPFGTIAATVAGMIIYIVIAFKLSTSASPEMLADTNNLVMADIAWQGWLIIPLGLAAATISSALGSIMVAPRTLQAIARDRLLPSSKLNYWLSRGKGGADEPYNATLITVFIAFGIVLLGELDFVAEIISMFFMVTYGSLCLISFFQHFAADPAYRPTFKSKWFISLFGAIACFGLMFLINPGYALLAVAFMSLIYFVVSWYNPDKRNMAAIFQGVIFQLSRRIQVFLQKAEKEQIASWRPSVICISEHSFERIAAFDLQRWIAHKYGFGTYIHKMEGYLSKTTNLEAKEAKQRLIKMAEASHSNVYIDTLISPSYQAAISQVIQLPGISGKENNLLLLEYSKRDRSNLQNIVDNFKLIKSIDFDVAILASTEKGFGLKSEIHIWITSNDYENANLMILLAYIILGHKEWSKGQIKIFAVFPEYEMEEERRRLFMLIETGRLPISSHNIVLINRKEDSELKSIIVQHSKDADLTIVGFRDERVKHDGISVFAGLEELGNTLYLNAARQKNIR